MKCFYCENEYSEEKDGNLKIINPHPSSSSTNPKPKITKENVVKNTENNYGSSLLLHFIFYC